MVDDSLYVINLPMRNTLIFQELVHGWIIFGLKCVFGEWIWQLVKSLELHIFACVISW